MANIFTRKPFSYTLGYSVKVPSGSTSQQLVRMPWQTPVQKPGYVRKVAITSAWGAEGALNIWDQDLSNTTPPTAGSAGAAIYSLEIGKSALSGAASETTLYTADQLADIPFIGGLACQSTVPGAIVSFDIEYI